MPLEADLVVTGATVLTMDPEQPEAEAVAARGERIVHVGAEAEALALAGEGARVVELGGGVVLPGFVDAHTHLVQYGVSLLRLDLADAPGLDEALQAVRQRAEMTPPGGWVVGHSWDESRWRERRRPRREELDAASPDNPVLLMRVDMHMGAANTAALEALGFAVDAHPEGHLFEEDFYRAFDAVQPAEATRVMGLERATRACWEHGVTSAHCIVDADDLRALQRARREGVLGVRVTCYGRRAHMAALSEAGVRRGFGDAWLRVAGFKLFADGSLGARTAALTEDYADAAGERGDLLLGDALEDLVARGHRAGLQPAVHCIGDAAVEAVLDAFEAAGLTAGDRPRLEHAELFTDAHVRRLAAVGAVASVQPNFTGQWGRPGGLYEDRLGKARAARANRLGVLAEAGVPLAFGSDHMPFGPLYGVHWAVNAPHPGQRVGVEEALAAYTRGAAWAAFEEGEKGVVREGLLADLVALAEDPREAPERIRDIPVALTVVGGRVVHERGQ